MVVLPTFTVTQKFVNQTKRQTSETGPRSYWTEELNSSSLPFFLSVQRFFLQESPVLYVQTLNDPSKALVLEEATLSWRKACPRIVNGGLEPERRGHAPEGTTGATTGAQPPLGVLGPEDTGHSLAPELHKINLVVSKVASSGPRRQASYQIFGA